MSAATAAVTSPYYSAPARCFCSRVNRPTPTLSHHHRRSHGTTRSRNRHARVSTVRAGAGGWLGGLFGGGREEVALDDADPDFRAWLTENGLPGQQKLVSRVCGEAGRGLVATSQVQKGVALLRVPRGLLIDADLATAESSIGRELAAAEVPSWTAIAAFLVEARFKAATQGSSYKWAPYIRQLPARTGCILEWSDAEVEGLLAGTSALRAARQIRAAAMASWQEVAPLVAQAEKVGALSIGVVTEEAMIWAFSILLSRIIRLPSLGDREVLVPWADFLNHSPSTSAHLDYDVGMEAVVLRPEHPCAAGDELFASYGERSSTDLLLSYGFVPNTGTNPYDSFLLPLKLDEKDPSYARKMAVLAEYGLGPAEDFPLRIAALPTALVPYQALVLEKRITGEAELFQLAGHFFEKPEREEPRVAEAYTVLLKRLKASLTELERGSAYTKAGNSLRVEQAAAIRKQEQRVLNRCEFFLREQMRALRRQVHGG